MVQYKKQIDNWDKNYKENLLLWQLLEGTTESQQTILSETSFKIDPKLRLWVWAATGHSSIPKSYGYLKKKWINEGWKCGLWVNEPAQLVV